ncbi:AAA family ATPase [Candidatus Woesearchaeota archaeon]|nr:AAA family ATPase [Candidatus Woesearchaeota archaeon]
MGLFDEMLRSDESLFKNSVALDYDFQPKLVPYRENEQRQIAFAVKPLFDNRTGRNLLVYGRPGVGKTVAIKHVLNELEEKTDEINVVYVNCWKKNTSYKIALELCDAMGYKFTQNKKTDELLKIIVAQLNKNANVLVFDEIDKAEDADFLYYLLEEIFKKSIILITNYKEWVSGMDARIKSRLTAEMLEFRAYTANETEGILRQRRDYAFVEGVWDDEAFDSAVRKTVEVGDIRSGLYLLKEAGNAAEDRSSRKISKMDAEKAIAKLDEFTIKDTETLEDDTKIILDIVKENTGSKIGELYKKYREKDGKAVYKTFQRKIAKLEKDRFVVLEKKQGGAEGTTTIVSYNDSTKKLSDF